MTVERHTTRKALASLLDIIGEEHPLGHQASKARRYVVSSAGGQQHEVMFEQSSKSPPNIWMTVEAAGPLVGGPIQQKQSPAASLRTTTGTTGKTNYGRHSALAPMPKLGDADLVCFAPKSLAEVGAILDQLL
jgi:hypothetical protein